ncbi:hypothetical protein [Agathobaculum sp.]|mgnify:FL=1|uniref:hypothetical protein n=1 Tax=Agathobaculum sp. TaxID=2048138 RepID=UPI003521811D
MKYRKKPIVVEAIRWTGDNGKEIEAFCGTDVMFGTIYEPDPVSAACIHTLNGKMYARPGDYIIKGVNGEFYPCKPDVFAKTYEAVEE